MDGNLAVLIAISKAVGSLSIRKLYQQAREAGAQKRVRKIKSLARS